jgi:hypothetical protein
MQLARPAIAADPRRFGRARQWRLPSAARELRASDDVRLFATTFVAGFVFVSLLIA